MDLLRSVQLPLSVFLIVPLQRLKSRLNFCFIFNHLALQKPQFYACKLDV